MKKTLAIMACWILATPVGDRPIQQPGATITRSDDGYFMSISWTYHDFFDIDWMEIRTRIGEDFYGDVCRAAVITPPEDVECIAWASAE